MEEERRVVHRCGGAFDFRRLSQKWIPGNWINNHADKQTTPTSTRWSQSTSWEALDGNW